MSRSTPAGDTGTRIWIDDGGEGDIPVVFLHALGGTSAQWKDQLSHLRKKRRATGIDLPGHGRSAIPPGRDCSISGLAEDVVAVASGLGFDRFVIAGHSLGAMAAIACAGACPERVAALFLLDPSPDIRKLPRGMVEGFINLLAPATYEGAVREYYASILAGALPATRAKVMEDLAGTPREVVAGLFTSAAGFDPITPLGRYDGPRLAVVTPANDAPESLHNLVAGLPHHIISGTSHWIQMDRPGPVNRILDGFLREVPPGR